MIDYTGRVVLELRTAAASWPAPFTDITVRGGELDAEDPPTGGTAPAELVVRRLAPLRRRRHPVATFPFRITCYYPDLRLVAMLAGLVSDAMHDRGPRVSSSGGSRIGAYNSADVGGSGSLVEDGTQYPREDVLIEVVAPTIALT